MSWVPGAVSKKLDPTRRYWCACDPSEDERNAGSADVADGLHDSRIRSSPAPATAEAHPQTILLLGSDRATSTSRPRTRSARTRSSCCGWTRPRARPRSCRCRATSRSTIPGHGTDKINAAYAIGGPTLAVKTIRALLGIPINHVVNVNFGGFRRAVDRLGCVYTDVDRRYFNDNSPPFGGGGNYATIDVKAGYQKLCGQDALDFVRYRHFDTDLVRAARQQQFLRRRQGPDRRRQAVQRPQGAAEDLRPLHADRHQLRATRSCGCSSSPSSRRRSPVQEVRFPGDITGDYVTVTAEHLAARSRERFMNATPSGTPRRGRGRRRAKTAATKSARRPSASVEVATLPPGRAGRRPGRRGRGRRSSRPSCRSRSTTRKAALAGASLLPDHSRAYDIFDRGGHKYRAYRMVFKTDELGQYYGVTGHQLAGRRRSSTTPASGAAWAGAPTSCSTTAAACGWSPGARARPSTGSRTRCCRSLGNQQMLALAAASANR